MSDLFLRLRMSNPTPSPLTTRIQRESDVVRALAPILRQRLPSDWTVELSVGQPAGRAFADAVLTIEAPDGSRADLVVEAKVRLDPREVEPAVQQARLLTLDLFDDAATRGAPLIAARFLSRRVRETLVAQGTNYADTTGNVRLVLARPGLFVETAGAERDPVPDERPLRSLKGAATARVVRALFDATTPVKLRELAEMSGASPAQTTRVVDLLDRETAIERDPRGSVLAVDRSKLIERWVDDYSFVDTNTTALFLEPRTLDKLLERLRQVTFPYAVSGSLAAREIAEYAEAKLGMVYVQDIDRAADDLNLTRVDSGGNVLLAEPSDPAVLDEVWEKGGVLYAAVSQVIADLLTSPGRGPAEGEELLRVTKASSGR